MPENLGELSNYAFDEAVRTLDRHLAGAPDEVRAALAVVRLVSGVPRRSPWYGIPIHPDDSSVTVGVALRNAFEAVGDWVDALGEGGQRVTKADHWFTKMYMGIWREGRAAWYDYLDHFTDPLDYERRYTVRHLEHAEYEAAMQRLAVSMRNLPPGVTRNPRGTLRGY